MDLSIRNNRSPVVTLAIKNSIKPTVTLAGVKASFKFEKIEYKL